MKIKAPENCPVCGDRLTRSWRNSMKGRVNDCPRGAGHFSSNIDLDGNFESGFSLVFEGRVMDPETIDRLMKLWSFE